MRVSGAVKGFLIARQPKDIAAVRLPCSATTWVSSFPTSAIRP
jgi:hypothetical protein